MINLFLFLSFRWLTLCHVTPFRTKPFLVAIPASEHVSCSDEKPLLETLEFFTISHDSQQALTFLRYILS